MRRNRNVKIVATLGPASSTPEQIKRLYETGVDVFRINMSHGDQNDAKARHTAVRQVEAEVGRPIAILADLQGPKLRIGVFAPNAEGAEEVELQNGQAFRMDLDPTPGGPTRVNLPHPEILSALKPGANLLVNDGKIRLRVTAATPEAADTVVETGGVISNRKGVNVPDVLLPLAALSSKDKSDLEFMCGLGVDWIGLSFVQRAGDVTEASELVVGRAAIMSKIEKPAAVTNIDEILEASDGIMVARGDLGVELPISSIPPIQKRLVRLSRNAGKPVVVATQMLESMIEAPTPTRAEVTDVANAIYEGADAVMLSAESAVGSFGPQAVETMDLVARSVENDANYRRIIDAARTPAEARVPDAITAAAREVAETLELKAICCFTHSGATVQRMARERPVVPIMAMTPFQTTARKLTIVWGAHCVVTEHLNRFKEAVWSSLEHAEAAEFADHGDRIAVVAGVPFNVAGTTNILRIAVIGEPRLATEGGD
ncbi:MAG: pyruvate kinase [Rhodobacteraceae bacterium]|nr:pyruvate kinase [Paracoccaceae bacterium]